MRLLMQHEAAFEGQLEAVHQLRRMGQSCSSPAGGMTLHSPTGPAMWSIEAM
jgi:hypothetical protein